MSPELTRLTIRTATWSRDSHGLFDYESKVTTKHTMNHFGDCKNVSLYKAIGTIVREENNLFLTK
jgi:hypothetical protein